MIRAVICDPDPDFTREICWLLRERPAFELIVSTKDPSQINLFVNPEEPVVLILGPGWREGLNNYIPDLRSSLPKAAIIVASPNPGGSESPPALSEDKTVRVLELPLDQESLADEITSAFNNISPEPKVPEPARGPQSAHRSQIITVFGTKGGVGKTVVASNLAVALANHRNATVILLDLDIQFGDVGIMLKLKPENTLYDAANMADDLNTTTLTQLLTPFSRNLRVLPAPFEPELADVIKAKHIDTIIETLSGCADYLVIDTPPSFNDTVLSALDRSDAVCHVTTIDLPSIKSTKLCLETFELLKYQKSRSHLVINRVDPSLGISQKKMETLLGEKSRVTIPADRHVPLSVNHGKPVVLDFPKSQPSRALIKLSRFFGEARNTQPIEPKLTSKTN
ncbi:MAG: CpaE family protein [Terriglobia bacterium]